ncbi:MAG: hypothetical protein WCV85_04355 [Patescibacteria group bacterium]|jgi:hypothetical protein
MKLFIFGAGASRGSTNKNVEHNSLQAPLANELLDDIYKSYADALDLNIDVLRADYKKYKEEALLNKQVVSLETWMTDLWHKAHAGAGSLTSEIITSYRGFLGRFAHYLRWMLQEISQLKSNSELYRLLLIKLHEEGVNGVEHAYVNFNYDTLFDIAYDDIWGTTLSDIDSYTSHRILKPHGSINWFAQKRDQDGGIPSKHADNDERNRYRVASRNLFNGSPVDLKDHRTYDPKSTLLHNSSFIGSSDFKGDYFQPLIFLPLSEKMFDHIPELSKKIEKAASEILPNVDQVYLIGYQANDKLIHEWISTYIKKAVLHVVSNTEDSCNALMSKMQEMHKDVFEKGTVTYDANDTSFKNGFYNFVESYGNKQQKET